MNLVLGLPALGIGAALTAWAFSEQSRPNIAVKLLSASFVLTAIAIFAACMGMAL